MKYFFKEQEIVYKVFCNQCNLNKICGAMKYNYIKSKRITNKHDNKCIFSLQDSRNLLKYVKSLTQK